MRKLTFILIMALCASFSMAAQRSKLSKEDRQKYLVEMRQFKHDFLVRELELSRDQQNQFFPLYDQMEDEINQVADETRELEAKVTSNADASDTEISSAARAVFEQKGKESAIELTYFTKFKEVLTPRQLLGLKNAEKKFTQQLMKQHGRTKSK